MDSDAVKIEKLKAKRRTLFVLRCQIEKHSTFERSNLDNRIDWVNRQLYKLTQDPIYNVGNKN